MKKFLSFVLTLLMIAAGAGLWGYHQIRQVLQQPISAQPDQLLTLERGTTGKKLAALFEREKLLEDAAWLPWDPLIPVWACKTHHSNVGGFGHPYEMFFIRDLGSVFC